jgi:hypothetical protein
MEKQKNIYEKWEDAPIKKYSEKEKEELLKKLKEEEIKK